MQFLQLLLLATASSSFVSAWSSLDGAHRRQTASQTLVDALSNYTELSNFRDIIQSFPAVIEANSDRGATLPVPTNDALNSFVKQNNATDVSQIPVARLQSIFRYHTLDAALSSSNLTAERGLTVPTKLVDALYNLREPGPAILGQFGAEAKGQVLYFAKDNINPAKVRVRQAAGTGEKLSLRAGLGQTAELTGIDGQWDGGYFQAIDTVLEVPGVCSTTIRKLSDSLSSLDSALTKVSLWKDLDRKPNITCLGPNTASFNAAANPEKNLNASALTEALLLHTLPEVAYSNFLADGQEFTSLGNVTVRVTIKGDDIWFNDAKVVSPNVLTNNGLIHVLDRVMTAEGRPDDSDSDSPSVTTSGTATPTGTATPSSTGNPPNAGHAVDGNLRAAGVIAIAAGILLI
ncbi:Periostin [Colletotrichum spinosum]|uniref:Periostin n=1 Tax=Colletotrichum spinosum TaxID=1347390 RepID=A0A4R8PPX9_9PEZI|nr:Periostin [Colletotrichum spinosum]